MLPTLDGEAFCPMKGSLVQGSDLRVSDVIQGGGDLYSY